MSNGYPMFIYVFEAVSPYRTLTSEVLPSNLQLYTSPFVLKCRFSKVFGRYLLCCVRIGLDWIQLLGHQLDWTGLGSVAHGFGLDWILSTQSISYSVRHKLTWRYYPMVGVTPKNVMSFKIFYHKLITRKQKKHCARFCSKLFKVSTTSVTLPEKKTFQAPTRVQKPRGGRCSPTSPNRVI